LTLKTTVSKKMNRRNRIQEKSKRSRSQKAGKQKSRKNSPLPMNQRTHLRNESEFSPNLPRIAVEDIWGIGRKYARFLRNYNIMTARDLRDADEKWIKKYLTVVGARIQAELRGTSCIPLETKRPPKQQIICAKSFGKEITSQEAMEEAVCTYLARAAEKLREQDSLAARITVFLRTNAFHEDAPQYSNSFTIELPSPTNFTPELFKYALKGSAYQNLLSVR